MWDTCAYVYQISSFCLTLCQGEVCTDDDADANDDANNDGQSMIV